MSPFASDTRRRKGREVSRVQVLHAVRKRFSALIAIGSVFQIPPRGLGSDMVGSRHAGADSTINRSTLRMSGMHNKQDVADRENIRMGRNGVAANLDFGLGTKTTYHLNDQWLVTMELAARKYQQAVRAVPHMLSVPLPMGTVLEVSRYLPASFRSHFNLRPGPSRHKKATCSRHS